MISPRLPGRLVRLPGIRLEACQPLSSGHRNTPRNKWDACEMLVAAELTLAGIPVLKVPDNWPGYDVIAQPPGDGKPQRISVKSRTFKRGPAHIGYCVTDPFDWLALEIRARVRSGFALAIRRYLAVPQETAPTDLRRRDFLKRPKLAKRLGENSDKARLGRNGCQAPHADHGPTGRVPDPRPRICYTPLLTWPLIWPRAEARAEPGKKRQEEVGHRGSLHDWLEGKRVWAQVAQHGPKRVCCGAILHPTRSAGRPRGFGVSRWGGRAGCFGPVPRLYQQRLSQPTRCR